jgi:DtxR family Mn-dependent transcriptional regulator
VLGNPDSDPHGDPIPTDDGTVPLKDLVSLATLKAGQGGEIVQIRHQDSETLKSLSRLGLMPGEPVTVVDHNALNDTITLRIGGEKTEVISTRVAEMILVKLGPH